MKTVPPSLRFDRVELLHLKPGWVFGPQNHPDWHELIYVVRGDYRVDTPQGRLSGPDGTVIYIPRGMDHRPWMKMGSDRRFFLLRWRDGRRPFLGTEPLRTVDVSGRMRVLLNWMWEMYPGGKADEPLFHALLYAVLAEFRSHRAAAVSQTLRRVLQHMRVSLSEPIRLRDLAEVAGCSPYYFARKFRKETGRTPMNYLAEMRIEAAQSLLRDTELPLKTIASRVGVANEYHLSRLVRRHAGRPPKVWRTVLRRGKEAPVPPQGKKRQKGKARSA
jgi:AraC-like DNA-binding protein